MRRAAMAFLIVGFMFGEMVPGLGQQPVAEAAGLTAAANSAKAKPSKKTVTFGGYSVSVPANWIALWDNAADLDGTPYVTSAVWPNASRSKQYQGNKTVKVGGISLQIDADMVAGPVVRK
jgi:hypothetical protein